jgi:hypothetical protein
VVPLVTTPSMGSTLTAESPADHLRLGEGELAQNPGSS